jgi:hypothetical protein
MISKFSQITTFDIEEIYRRRAFLYFSTIDESMMVAIFTKQEKGKHFI